MVNVLESTRGNAWNVSRPCGRLQLPKIRAIDDKLSMNTAEYNCRRQFICILSLSESEKKWTTSRNASLPLPLSCPIRRCLTRRQYRHPSVRSPNFDPKNKVDKGRRPPKNVVSRRAQRYLRGRRNGRVGVFRERRGRAVREQQALSECDGHAGLVAAKRNVRRELRGLRCQRANSRSLIPLSMGDFCATCI